MEFEVIKKEDHVIVRVLSKKLDTNNAPELKSELVVLGNDSVKNIILDVSNCSYIDSSGLSAILVANRLCEDAIGTFILCGLQPDVEHLIRISMLHTVLLITKDVNEAEGLLVEKSKL
ncbi:STAS domain-containing protein [Sunxiuqinia elliptica]|uniref:Anti-sigma factor antagonist n=1 Tax=Sunxiuqinia elliptica TaxID=655355 RepID=A0A4R6GRN6_9BACT|nr:STAS domain-containing protein [Sunxiuqinia elliptica]TDN97205.1 anti-anti-sigma factor [Sunxiuqinia elliptica]TDO60611.1 anti-anti-sigma factor [Sunxiuqinia elliptica]